MVKKAKWTEAGEFVNTKGFGGWREMEKGWETRLERQARARHVGFDFILGVKAVNGCENKSDDHDKVLSPWSLLEWEKKND